MRILYVLLDFSQKYFLWIKCPNSYECITPQFSVFVFGVKLRALTYREICGDCHGPTMNKDSPVFDHLNYRNFSLILHSSVNIFDQQLSRDHVDHISL